jgi:Cft2 family RNA processing exonuclease
LTQWLEKLIHDKNNNYLIKGGHKRFVFNNILLMNWPFKEHKPTIVAIEKKKEKKKKKIIVPYDYILRFDLTF